MVANHSMIRHPRQRLARLLLPLVLPWCGIQVHAQDPAPPPDLLAMDIETLMKIEVQTVSGASKFSQKVTDTSASISAITADEIRRYGYRTLADTLASVPGFYITYDRNYRYLGVRGFGPPGDFNSRVLLLADGHRINDNIDDQAFIGTDFPVNLDLIDRVEVIRGPNSSLYVASALLAVINVVTKPVRNARGLEASAELASWGTFKSRLTYGHQFASGLAMLLSGSYYNSQGHDALYFAEFDTPSTNHGMALNLDGDVSRQLFATFSLHNFRLEAAYGSRQKDVPAASYGSLFNVSPNYTVDTREYVDLQYDRAFGSNWGLLGHLYYDRYPFENAGIFDFSPLGGPPGA